MQFVNWWINQFPARSWVSVVIMAGDAGHVRRFSEGIAIGAVRKSGSVWLAETGSRFRETGRSILGIRGRVSSLVGSANALANPTIDGWLIVCRSHVDCLRREFSRRGRRIKAYRITLRKFSAIDEHDISRSINNGGRRKAGSVGTRCGRPSPTLTLITQTEINFNLPRFTTGARSVPGPSFELGWQRRKMRGDKTLLSG